MQRALRLDARIEAPRMDDLHHAGHRIGEPSPGPKTPRPSSERPAARAKSSNRRSPSGVQSLYVSNLPWGATTDELAALFGRYGKVHETTIIAHPRTGRSKGFGFVEMGASDARTAVKELHGSVMGGRDLTVRPARPKGHRG
jgi:RNA recognition motif-containing protein